MVKNINNIICNSNISKADIEKYSVFVLENCIVKSVNLIGAYELDTKLILENCIIENFNIHSCWFYQGLLLKNCIFKNDIDYQMGGHNCEKLLFEGNIFTGFFNFFDCQFDGKIILKSNVFFKGANLIGNKTEGFTNTFKNGYLLENNIGSVDLDRV